MIGYLAVVGEQPSEPCMQALKSDVKLTSSYIKQLFVNVCESIRCRKYNSHGIHSKTIQTINYNIKFKCYFEY